MSKEYDRKEIYPTDYVLSLLPNRGQYTPKEFKKYTVLFLDSSEA